MGTVTAVIAHVDKVFTSGTKAEIDALKANWGMQNLTHLDDVAGSRKCLACRSPPFCPLINLGSSAE